MKRGIICSSLDSTLYFLARSLGLRKPLPIHPFMTASIASCPIFGGTMLCLRKYLEPTAMFTSEPQ